MSSETATTLEVAGARSGVGDAAAEAQPTAGIRFLPRFLARLLGAGCILTCSAGASEPLVVADFETDRPRIEFSAGTEFPGASGRFERSPAAAYQGQYGGRLHFDFSRGGRYVALILQPPAPADRILELANALEIRVRRPWGHELAFRYTDAAGQTFQKPVETAADEWCRAVIPFEGWTGHWGGANDGQVRGGPVRLALLVELGETAAGHVDFDELRLIRHVDPIVRVGYPAWRFLPEEGWTLRSHGPAGDSRLEGRHLRLDFTRGAQGFSLVPPDRSLPGSVDRLALRVFGRTTSMPVRFALRTHFMTFHRTVGNLEGDGHLEVQAGGPPGPGWEWSGGENDGRLHGPLRVGEIRLGRPVDTERVELELEEVYVEASSPASRRSLMSAALTEDPAEPEFELTVRTLTVEPIAARVRWELRDWEGRRLDQGSEGLTLAPRTEPVRLRIPAPLARHPTLKFLEATFHLEADGLDVPSVQAAWVAPIEDAGNARLQPGSPFGMGAYLYRYPANEAGYAEMQQAAAVAQAAGVKWSREEFQWSRIEPRRGDFQWAFYDRLIETAKAHGIQVYAIVAYWSPWTRPYTAEGIDDYVRYLEALVRRYREDIRHWEIWNEPNIFFWQGPRDLYADLLKKSYAAVKAIDPDAQVLGLSTAGIDLPYIRRMLELEAPFDVLTIHPYRRTLNDRAFLADLIEVSDLVRLPDGTRRPVWLTELGWPTYAPHNTLRQSFVPTTHRAQAELIVRCYLLAIVSGIEPRTFWYNFRNDGEDPFYFEHQMGIVDRQFRPKPAYRTYATLTRVLDGLEPGPGLQLESDTLGWAFTDPTTPNRRVTVLWNPRRETVVDLPVRTSAVVRLNAVGEASRLEASGGRVRVPLSRGAAVYVLESDG